MQPGNNAAKRHTTELEADVSESDIIKDVTG
ncbi:hypothetical protein HDF17_000437 [Granulicella arctica]|uniref:Uncharacterized protein n=1 Tax=Granulicella arctica TaxID=940613 RepID=A0A7Y9PEC8_9BACT|nr:hypothetical protein [Granulicella arctica]